MLSTEQHNNTPATKWMWSLDGTTFLSREWNMRPATENLSSPSPEFSYILTGTHTHDMGQRETKGVKKQTAVMY